MDPGNEIHDPHEISSSQSHVRKGHSGPLASGKARVRDLLQAPPWVPRGLQLFKDASEISVNVQTEVRQRTNATVGALRGLWRGRLELDEVTKRARHSDTEWVDSSPHKTQTVCSIAAHHAEMELTRCETPDGDAFAKVVGAPSSA